MKQWSESALLARPHAREAVVLALLAGALALCVVLAQSCFEFYRREQRVRLQPARPAPPPPRGDAGREVALFLGDSRMQEWPDLPKSRFVTVNAGAGGETTAQVRLRAAATLDAVRPALVVLQAGINDLKTIGALPDAAMQIEANCLENLTTLVELCRARGARVVLVPVLPAARPSLARRLVWSPEIDAARQRVNQQLRRRFAAAERVALLDEQILRPDTAADYRDTLHFKPEAYAKLEAATLRAIAGP